MRTESSKDQTPSGDQELLLTSDQVNRIWSHSLHVDNMLVQRGNFFLVAESMLLVAYASLLGAVDKPHVHGLAAVHIIAWFGLALTLIWAYTCVRHYHYLRHLKTIAARHMTDYAMTTQTRPGPRFPASALMAYAVPGITVVMWIMLLLLV